MQREQPDVEATSEVMVEDDHFFYIQVYKRIESTRLEYMHATEIIDTNDARNVIKWYRVIGASLILPGLAVLLTVLFQRDS
jgi:hypothetical protein